MHKEFITSGYLDVKISAKVKRGFTPWKAWKKQWCEIKRLDNIENGLEIKLKNAYENNSANIFLIPRDSTICRTESRSKNYSFGIFGPDRCHKPLVFLSGGSESDSQLWMYSIRRLLSLNSHLPIIDEGYYISLIDNDHSRIAGLTGLHGVLTTDLHEVIIRDPATRDVKTSISCHHVHQYHLAATNSLDDDKKIIVVHTSKHFHAGAGQLYFFCLQASSLLNYLVSRGKIPKIKISSLPESKRLSRSEGDLRDNESLVPSSPTTPSCYYTFHSGSDDSGVRVSMASDDSSLILKCKKAVSSLSLGFVGFLVATPGGSEIDNDSHSELLLENDELSCMKCSPTFGRSIDDPRRESGVSIMSGVYEEISEIPPPREFQNCSERKSLLHTYEDPVDIILKSTKKFTPPPLPPRREIGRLNSASDDETDSGLSSSTTPPKNSCPCANLVCLSTQSESEYMVMTGKSQNENLYLPMKSSNTLQVPQEENQYMVMTGKNKT